MLFEYNFMCFVIVCVDFINLLFIDILIYCIKLEKFYNKLLNLFLLIIGNNKFC